MLNPIAAKKRGHLIGSDPLRDLGDISALRDNRGRNPVNVLRRIRAIPRKYIQ